MNLASACFGTLTRTIVLCLVAWPICVLVERWVRRVSDAGRPFAFGLVLVPCLFPELLVGYTYRDAALSSTRFAEWMCLGLLLIRIVPVGVVTLLASPLSLAGQTAIFCRWLKLRENFQSFREMWRFGLCLWHGPVRRALPALGLMSVIAFQEFELAALLQTASWTDWFIAAQRFGLGRDEMLRQSLWPILIQLPLLVGVVCWTVRQHDSQTDSNDEVVVRESVEWATKAYLGLAFLFGGLIPLGFMASNLLAGLKMIARQPTQLTGLLQEMGVAASVSICAALTTWSASRWLLHSNRGGLSSRLIRQGLLLPGLAGSLLVSLCLGMLFQQPWLRVLYDTPLPWVLALVVWLLPRAVLVRLWLDTMTQTEAVHLAEMLNARRAAVTDPSNQSRGPIEAAVGGASPALRPSALLFRLRDQPRLLAVGLLCYWAYLDLSTAYLLAPSGMPSGLVRLYNFMHFGRSSALSAEAFLFFGGPGLAIGVATAAWGIVRRRKGKNGK
jgi:hypothetical protein